MIKIKDTEFIVGLIIESGLLSFVISLQFDGLTNAIGKIHSSIWRVAFKMLNVWINVWSMLRRFNWILNFSTFNIYLTHFADNLCEWATVDKLINGPALLCQWEINLKLKLKLLKTSELLCSNWLKTPTIMILLVCAGD